MLTTVRRIIAWGAIAFALAILSIDLFTMLEKGSAFSAHSIGQDWQLYSRGTYVSFKVWLGHVLPPKPVGYVEVALGLWTWAAIAVAGLLIAPLRHASQ